MTTPVTFPGALGNQLSGLLHSPSGRQLGSALFAHCFTCSKDLHAARRIAEALAARGIAVLRFDFTGLGSSEGDFADSNFSSNVDDVVAAADFMRDALGHGPRVLIGHSLGGAAVLTAASRIAEAAAIATIGAPADVGHVRHLLRDAHSADDDAIDDAIARDGEAEVILAGRPFRIKAQFLRDLEGHTLLDRVSALGKPLLLCHAPGDRLVAVDNARLLFQAARHPKSFVSLDDADHLLTRKADATYVGSLIAAWAERYLALPSTENAREGEVVVRGGPSGYGQDILAGRHHVRADEPEHFPGGTDTGPSPYDLLLASLGACTSMTLRMYADRKKWPLEGVTVRLRHEKIYAKDCADCETKTGKVDRIERELTIHGPLDDAQKKRLHEIADKCPVHRTLHAEIKVVTTLTD